MYRLILPASDSPPAFFLNFPSAKKEPASVFDDSGLDALNLFARLNEKIVSLCLRENLLAAVNQFAEWFRQERSKIVGIIFHGGEVIFDEVEPLNMHIISTSYYSHGLLKRLPSSLAMLFWPTVSDPMKIDQECAKAIGSGWRAFLSSELIIIGGNRKTIQWAVEIIEQAKDRFEEDAIPDIAQLIALDVRAKVFCDSAVSRDVLYVKDEGATKGLTKKGFERIATKAMEKRRVAKEIRRKVLPQVQMAVAR